MTHYVKTAGWTAAVNNDREEDSLNHIDVCVSTVAVVCYLAGLIVLQPALQVSSIDPGVKAASLKGQQVPGG